MVSSRSFLTSIRVIFEPFDDVAPARGAAMSTTGSAAAVTVTPVNGTTTATDAIANPLTTVDNVRGFVRRISSTLTILCGTPWFAGTAGLQSPGVTVPASK